MSNPSLTGADGGCGGRLPLRLGTRPPRPRERETGKHVDRKRSLPVSVAEPPRGGWGNPTLVGPSVADEGSEVEGNVDRLGQGKPG
ncbi:hypothetical protein E4U26_005102, partial [Claviceps purpurea]